MSVEVVNGKTLIPAFTKYREKPSPETVIRHRVKVFTRPRRCNSYE
jgi:hypothetical protein